MKYLAYCRKSSEGEERQALSIPAQIDEIKRVFDPVPEIEIVEWFEEKMSAKAPGRPLYAEMIKRIENGEADGIVAWHPDRLARNSVDGGWIIHLLDRGVLKDLKFVSYSYEQSPQGMFMLQIMFGQSKYYIDNLSVNVKRGMRKKIEMGWLPNLAPLGYRNDRETGTIAIDSERFPILRSMWELLLTGTYSVSQINGIANNQLGFRTPVRKKSGGRPISLSVTYKMFNNPFYAGILDWYGEWRPGKHQPMVSIEEFHRARAILTAPARPKPETHNFAYTGLIRCACGLSVTAEEKIKPSGRRYVYYHCTRRARPRCDQPAVRVEVIEDRIVDLLRGLCLPDHIEQMLSAAIREAKQERRQLTETQALSAEKSLQQIRQNLRTLTDLRVGGLIDDTEFLERRSELSSQELRLQQKASDKTNATQLGLELAECAVLFRKYAADWFADGNGDDKRMIVLSVCSNAVLGDGKLSVQARFPFELIDPPAYRLPWRAIVEAIGTSVDTSDAHRLIDSIKHLEARAAARREKTLAPPLPASLSMRRTAPRGRAAWRVNRGPLRAKYRGRARRERTA